MQSVERDETLPGEHRVRESKKNVPASVLNLLLNHSRAHKEDYQSLLTRYVAERFLFRLGRYRFRDRFVLKGAYLLTVLLDDQKYRTTKDIDFLKTGETDVSMVRDSLQGICSIPYPPDAVSFDPSSIALHEIREQNVYRGTFLPYFRWKQLT